MAKKCSVRNQCSYPRADWWLDGLYGTGAEEEVVVPPTPPDYASLTGLQLLVDYTGLVTNTNNTYGIVDGSGNVTTLKSLAPSPLTRDFVSNGTAPTLAASGIVFGGAGRLRAGVDSKTWANFMHYNATRANLKWTVHAVVKFGITENPSNPYGLIGNNGTSSANKGIAIFFADSNTTSNNAVVGLLTMAVVGLNNTQSDCLIPNRFFVLTIETDLSLAVALRQKIYINAVLVLNTGVADSGAALVTAPTYDLELGGSGNATVSLVGTIKELTIQSAISSEAVRNAFITALIAKHNLTRIEDSLYTDKTFNLFNIFDESRYCLSNKMLQSISNQDVIVEVFSDWELGHTWRDGNCISMRKSTDRGRTWSAKTVIYNPASLGVVDSGGGVDPDTGTMYCFADVHDGSGTTMGSNHSLILLSSTDDGDNWATTDLSSLIPATESLRAKGTVIKNNNVLMFPFYTIDAEGDLNPNSRYIARKDGAGAWTAVLVETTTTTFINESDIISLGGDNLLMVSRNETTKEFTQYVSTDNGLNWTNQGDLTFGETWVQGAPPVLRKLQISGVDVIACYITDRDNRKGPIVIYALPANLIASGLTGWNLSTKTLLRIPPATKLYHYGDVIHPYNDFRALGQYAYDTTGYGITTMSVMHTFDLQTWHYATVKTALGL